MLTGLANESETYDKTPSLSEQKKGGSTTKAYSALYVHLKLCYHSGVEGMTAKVSSRVCRSQLFSA